MNKYETNKTFDEFMKDIKANYFHSYKDMYDLMFNYNKFFYHYVKPKNPDLKVEQFIMYCVNKSLYYDDIIKEFIKFK